MNDKDIEAVQNLLHRIATAETTLWHINEAWLQLVPTQKIEIDAIAPDLTKALVQIDS